MSVAAPECMTCKHYNRDDEEKMSCKAFPEGIPEEIVDGDVDHHTPIKGDHGITYEEVS